MGARTMASQPIERMLCALAVLAFGLVVAVPSSERAARALDFGTGAPSSTFGDAAAETGDRHGIVAVEAPSGARAVELQFSFGARLPMGFDADHGHWHAVADLPPEVPDGVHQVSIKVTLADGSVLWRYADYELRAAPSEFELSVDDVVVAGETLDLLVDPNVPLASVTVYFAGLELPPKRLVPDVETGLFHLEVPVPRDFEGRGFRVRVVGSGEDLRTSESTRTIEVIPAIECCHEEPEEDC